MINFGISSTIIRNKEVYAAIDTIGKSVFNWIEIRCEETHFKYEDVIEIKRVRESLRKNRIKGCSLHPPGWVDIANEEEWTRMKSVREVEKIILVAQRLKISRVIVHPGYKDGSLEQSIKSLNEIVEFGKVWKVDPVLENTFPGHFGSEPLTLKNIASEFDLSICLDTSHAAAKGGRVEEFLIMLGERIKHFHISDSNKEGKDDHLMPFEGKINWNPVIAFISEFDGYIVFELPPIEDLNETLNTLCKITDKWQKKI